MEIDSVPVCVFLLVGPLGKSQDNLHLRSANSIIATEAAIQLK